jgi:putative flippase GtrA
MSAWSADYCVAMPSGLRVLTAEFARMVVSGVAASLVAFLLFNWLLHWGTGSHEPLLHEHAVLAFLVANVSSIALTYLLSKTWVFRDRDAVGFANGKVTFVVISVLTLAIPTACLSFSRNVLGLESALADNIAANVIGLFLGFVARFSLFRTLVFTPKATDDTGLAVFEDSDR